MNCPNCGSLMSEKRKRCERCGTDLTLYKKIWNASNLYYNNGLIKAKVRDLSGAVIDLRNSLELNKMNTNARNLLGLIYFEMGETVDALSEWVISKHFKPEDNDADEYINAVQSNPTKLDGLNQAIKRYNNALNYAKQGSDDLAIIQLKKVTSLNPRFIRAHQLLALLYMKSNENEKAKRCLIRALKIDVSNTTCLRYLKDIETPEPAVKDANGNFREEPGAASAIVPLSSYKEDKPNILAFVNLVIGVIIGVAAVAALVIPSIKRSYQAKENDYYTEYSEGLAIQAEKEETIKALQKDIERLEKEKRDIQAQLDGIVIPDDKSDFYHSLIAVTQLYIDELNKKEEDRDLVAVADNLYSNELLQISLNQEDAQAEYDLINRLKEGTYPVTSDYYYDIGHDQYRDAKYEEALATLEKALDFNPQNDDAVYFIARAYHRLEDYDNAALYYNIILTDFPDSNRTTDAKRYLKNIQD